MKKIGLISWSENKKIQSEIKRRLEDEGMECITASEDDDLDLSFAGCNVIVAVLTDKQNDSKSSANKILTGFVGARKQVVVYLPDKTELGKSLDFLAGGDTAVLGSNDEKAIPDRLFEVIASIEDEELEGREKRQEVDNFGRIKFLSRPIGKVINALLFLQIFIASIWLSSTKSEYFLLLTALIIGAYVLLFVRSKKLCSIKGCRKKCAGTKNINRKDSSKSVKLGFCSAHMGETVQSADKVSFNIMYPVVAVLTAAFVVLFAVGAVVFDDFLFMDLRERIDDNRPVIFHDAGFESFIRSEFGFEGGIAKVQLKGIDELHFTDENCTVPIESLEDLEYFPNLTLINLGNQSHVGGSIDSFKYTPKIRYIDLGNSSVAGDIEVCAQLPDLKSFVLDAQRFHNDITGDIAAFKNCLQIDHIGLAYTAVYGDIADISTLPIELLYMDDTAVHGDLSSLAGMKDMMALCLAVTQVKGDIAVLANMPELRHIGLEGADITGDIAVFENNPNLRQAAIYNSDIYGDISVFGALKKIEIIWLGGCNRVTGDIAGLENMPWLRDFDVFGTNIYGDAEAFRDGHLIYVNIDGTDIYGDLDVFAEHNQLKTLMIFGTNVTGDVSVLKDLNLEEFGAHENVYGPLDAFSNMSNLYALNIPRSNVYGDVSCLKDLPNLQIFDYEDSLVSDEANGVYVDNLNLLSNMFEKLMVDYHLVWMEGEGYLNVNNMSNFGYTDSKEIMDDWMVFTSSEPRELPLLFKLDSFRDSEILGNQALHIKFKPSSNNMGFVLNGSAENGGRFSVDFADGSPRLLIETDDIEILPDSDFILEADEWYHLFVGLNRGGHCVCVIWKDRFAEDACRIEFAEDMVSDAGRYQNQAWDFSFVFNEASSITVAQYDAYKFRDLK